MIRRLDIDRVLLTRTAAIVLGIAALISAAVTPLFHADLHFGALSRSDQIFFSAARAIGALGILLLLAGMWLFWIACDLSTKRTRTIWFFVLLIGFSYGAIPYYIFIYFPCVRRRLREAERRIS